MLPIGCIADLNSGAFASGPPGGCNLGQRGHRKAPRVLPALLRQRVLRMVYKRLSFTSSRTVRISCSSDQRVRMRNL